MKSPFRLFNALIDHHRLAERRRQVEWELGVIFKTAITLQPTLSGGGFDRMYLAHRDSDPMQTIASVRINVPGRNVAAKEPNLPRLALSAENRIHREARAYRQLSTIGLTPRLITRGDFFLANHWLTWPRFSDILRHHGHLLWDILPVVLNSIREMHENDVVHMDLNDGNILIAPNFQSAVIIDFEYSPLHSMSLFDQQRFDFLRFAHNLLKPRRGREAAFQQPQKFVDLFAKYVPEAGYGIPDAMDSAWFSRVNDHPMIRRGFEEIFGVLDMKSRAAA